MKIVEHIIDVNNIWSPIIGRDIAVRSSQVLGWKIKLSRPEITSVTKEMYIPFLYPRVIRLPPRTNPAAKTKATGFQINAPAPIAVKNKAHSARRIP